MLAQSCTGKGYFWRICFGGDLLLSGRGRGGGGAIGGLFLSIYYDLPLAKRRRRITQRTAFARDNKKHMI
jgi:hypothetical protein